MTLTSQQVREARKICKENGIYPEMVTKTFGDVFWNETCGGTFEGYINYLLNGTKQFNGSITTQLFNESRNNYRNGQAGKSSL